MQFCLFGPLPLRENLLKQVHTVSSVWDKGLRLFLLLISRTKTGLQQIQDSFSGCFSLVRHVLHYDLPTLPGKKVCVGPFFGGRTTFGSFRLQKAGIPSVLLWGSDV